MKRYMNEPVEYNWTDEDIIKEYERIQDKKKISKIFGVTTQDVTRIIKKGKI